jgi:hypothetical protein
MAQQFVGGGGGRVLAGEHGREVQVFLFGFPTLSFAAGSAPCDIRNRQTSV